MSAYCMQSHQVTIAAVCMMQCVSCPPPQTLEEVSETTLTASPKATPHQVTQCKQSIQQDVRVYGAATITIKLSKLLDFFPLCDF